MISIAPPFALRFSKGEWRVFSNLLARIIHTSQQSRREPSGAKATGLSLGAACKLSFWSGRLGKMRAACRAPYTALNLFASVPSLLQAHPSFDIVSRLFLGP